MSFPDVELIITRDPGGITTAGLRVELPAGRADLAEWVPIRLNDTMLRAFSANPHDYGQELTRTIFGPELREAWQRMLGFAEGTGDGLRIRLTLQGDDALQAIHWELLCDPLDNAPLAHSERLLFSRFLSSSRLTNDSAPFRPDLCAVVAVASPAWLGNYGLAPVDVPAAVERARAGLGDIPTIVLDGRGGRPAASLPAIVSALSSGSHILYLVCHGALRNGKPCLWLEHDGTGSGRPIEGDALVEKIKSRKRPPRLVILASCQSAGDTYTTLAAVGPRLARAGVGATIAMQGEVPGELVAQLTPRLFAELRDDGQIDRALAVARATISREQPWWMPVLWMTVRDGRLWASRSAPATPAPVPITTIVNVYQSTIVDSAAQQEQIDLMRRRLREHRESLAKYRVWLKDSLPENQRQELVAKIAELESEVRSLKFTLREHGHSIVDCKDDVA